MTEVNVPLLRKALEHITAHPEEWDQTQWAQQTSCGTACCVAGHVALMTGHEIDFGRVDVYSEMVTHTTTGRYIEDVARYELGLTSDQSRILFDEMNRLPTLWAYAKHLSNGEITAPPEVSA